MRYTFTSLICCAIFLLSGCLKDTLETTYTYTMARPVYGTSDAVRSSIGNQSSMPVSSPGKMYLSGSYIFLNEINKGIHIINNSNPSKPVNEAFVAIPGCVDMAVMGNLLYADCYTDLMVIDISNPKSVTLKNYVPNLFPDRQYVMGYRVDSGKVIVNWIVKDTTITYKMQTSGSGWINGGIMFDNRQAFASFSSNSGGAKSIAGKGGSMARFAITHNHLYAVTNNKLLALGLEQPQLPALKSTKNLPWGIETIYPFKNRLFIGSNDGMYIFSIDEPYAPIQVGTFAHARVCDPVIADDDYAYVTLRSGSICQGFINQMDVVDISNVFSPKLVKSYPLTNPHGLDKDDNFIYVCDGKAGLKVLDATNVLNVTLKKTIPMSETFDVICWNKIAIVSAADGLHQLDISNVNNIKELSFIGLEN